MVSNDSSRFNLYCHCVCDVISISQLAYSGHCSVVISYLLVVLSLCYSNNSFAGATVNSTESPSDPVVFFLLFLIAFAEHNFSKVQL